MFFPLRKRIEVKTTPYLEEEKRKKSELKQGVSKGTAKKYWFMLILYLSTFQNSLNFANRQQQLLIKQRFDKAHITLCINFKNKIKYEKTIYPIVALFASDTNAPGIE